MPIVNAGVAVARNKIADLLKVQGASVVRVRAWRRAPGLCP